MTPTSSPVTTSRAWPGRSPGCSSQRVMIPSISTFGTTPNVAIRITRLKARRTGSITAG